MAYNSKYTGQEIDAILDKVKYLPSTSGSNGMLLVSDGIQANWQEVIALPKGGEIGQILAKKSNTDGDGEWITLSKSNITDFAHTHTSSEIIGLKAPKLYKATLKAADWVYTPASGATGVATNSGYWKMETFAAQTVTASIKQTLATVAPLTTRYVQDAILYDSGDHWGDQYTARCTIYVYCAAPVTLTFSCGTDDEGAWFLNDQLLGTNTSTAYVNLTFNFLAGQNKIECFYHEGSGGDWWVMKPGLNTRVGSDFLNISAEPIGAFTQTITPTCIGGNNTISENTIFSSGTIKGTGIALTDEINIKQKNIINDGLIIGNANHSITVKCINPVQPSTDITMYWFASEEG